DGYQWPAGLKKEKDRGGKPRIAGAGGHPPGQDYGAAGRRGGAAGGRRQGSGALHISGVYRAVP
ncbi:MAG: hypothetical protein LBF78_09275, partial [Treponema sp.]|nr:hypothetical protein [Treponema sp.]